MSVDPETTQSGTDGERFILENSADMLPAVFPLGASVRLIDADLRLRDRLRRLNLAGLLDSTPYHWVWLPGYRVARSLVTNGQYREFLHDAAFEDEGCWAYVWEDLGRRILQHNRCDQGADGRPQLINELHSGARNFVEAYLDSLELEVLQWAEFDALPEPGADPPSADASGELDVVTRKRTVERVFAFAKSCLARAIAGERADDVLLPKAQQSIEVYFEEGGADRLKADMARIRSFTVHRLSLLVPPLQRDKLRRAPHEMVESIAILDRVQREWLRCACERRIDLRAVLYPRAWSTPEGERPTNSRFRVPAVPWESRPVFGLTLYEATAYCAWLSHRTEWRYQVDLPNEAQYERAASWPNERTAIADGRCTLNPKAKLLFPWQDHCREDFNDLFGQDQNPIERLYSDPQRYRELVARTTRRLAGDEQLDQLLGFGWQWTMERFDNSERRYSRFDQSGIQHQAVVVHDQSTDQPAPVYVYKPRTDMGHSHFVVRGAPEILGGPGLTTRRFAMYPLRSYPDVGFRWVATERQDGEDRA